MNSTKEDSSGGQHRAPNHGPTGLNTGQRSIVRNPESVTSLDVEEAHRHPGQGVNVPAQDRSKR
jgi:hypothetical protein